MSFKLKSLLPYGFVSGRLNFNFRKWSKNLLPAFIVESIIKKNTAKTYTVQYLKNHYVSDLTENEKWTLLAFLLMLEKTNINVNYLEIGIYAGGTIKFLFENTSKTKFTGVDLFEDFVPSIYNTHIWKNYTIDQVSEALGRERVVLYKGDSVEILKSLEKQSTKFDLIFIDGNHTYQATKSDFEGAFPLLNFGGYIAFHNCSPGMTQEDKYYVKLDGGPWLVTQELMMEQMLKLVSSTDRIQIFKSI